MTLTRVPAWRYHATHGGRIFQTDAELDALPPDWHDHPDKCRPRESLPVEATASGDAAAPADGAVAAPEPSPSVEAAPPSPAPPRRKNRFNKPGMIG